MAIRGYLSQRQSEKMRGRPCKLSLVLRSSLFQRRTRHPRSSLQAEKVRRFGHEAASQNRWHVFVTFAAPSGSVQVLFHCPVKGEPQKGSAQKVTFKSPKHDLNMTLKLFHGWIPFAVPLFRGSDSCLSRGTALARAAPERVSGRITCLTLLV